MPAEITKENDSESCGRKRQATIMNTPAINSLRIIRKENLINFFLFSIMLDFRLFITFYFFCCFSGLILWA